MHFTRLRLSGFKSFVDPTELVIEPGLTGVVGPNGCGKSNLLEAIRWAMGENRAKSLRGSGMDDVIFAGTGKRPPRNMAEVTLVLDNDSRSAPPPFTNEAHLEVTRRIERDSGSAYRINGEDVRQKDVQLLFADAATGAHSPALVSQGRIGALINARPQDRRQVLEEAAGISGLHQRRKEAESRLKSAETNLSRLQDVLQAMESQVASLRRQARQAARYKELSGDLEKVEAGLLYLRWKQAADEVVARESTHRQAEKLVAAATERASAAARSHAKLAAALAPLRDAQVAAAAALQRIRLERDNFQAEQRRRAEALERLAAVLETIAADSERESGLLSDASAALERLLAEKKRLEAEGEGEADAREVARNALEKAAAAATEAERAYDQVAEQTAGVRARKSSLESDLLALNRRLEQLAADRARREQELGQLASNKDESAAIDALKAEITAMEQASAEHNSALLDIEAEVAEAQTASDTRTAALSEARGALNTTSGELKSLEKLVASYADSKTRVMDQVSATAGYEDALGAALGGLSEAGLDEADLRHVRALDALDSNDWPAEATALTDHVTVPQALARLIDFTAVVDSGDRAAQLQPGLRAGQQLASRDGGLWRWDGYVVRPGAPSRAAALLRDQNRLADLRQSHDKQQAEVGSLQHQAEAAKTGLADLLQKQRALRDRIQKSEAQTADKRRQLIKLEEEASRRQNKATAVRDALARIDEDQKAQQERAAKVKADVAALPALQGLEDDMASLKQQVTERRSQLASARAAYDSLEREVGVRTSRLKSLARDMADWQQRRDRAAEQIETLAERAQTTRDERDAMQISPDSVEAERVKLDDAVEAAEQALSAEQDKLAAAEASLKEADGALKLANENLSAVREDAIRAEAALESSVERRKEVSARIAERFECAPTEVLEQVGADSSHSLPALAVLESKLENLRRERDRLGAVNLRAEEELEELSEQTGHLIGEREELEAAIQRLRGAISSLNREGRERLLAAFEVVNNHFGELFATLFGGGEAHLELSESDDPLDAGLEIYASPPGKKLQGLSLLSGGEQALTALSLIFAVFITNPAPICVLDEVDAPLDDANVERFCNLLDNMITRTATRFLIVTHNAVTMARVNRLFGVTMAERGVSTLVSVDLERATALTEQ